MVENYMPTANSNYLKETKRLYSEFENQVDRLLQKGNQFYDTLNQYKHHGMTMNKENNESADVSVNQEELKKNAEKYALRDRLILTLLKDGKINIDEALLLFEQKVVEKQSIGIQSTEPYCNAEPYYTPPYPVYRNYGINKVGDDTVKVMSSDIISTDPPEIFESRSVVTVDINGFKW